jgi:hypothetical protein
MFGFSVGNKKNSSDDYTLNDINISKVDVCKDLGVIIDQRLSFTQHINAIVPRAHAGPSLFINAFYLGICNISSCFYHVCASAHLVFGLHST